MMTTPVNDTHDDILSPPPFSQLWHFGDDSNCPASRSLTSIYDYVDKSCEELEIGWKGIINMPCIIDGRSLSSHDILSRAGLHQFYSSKSLSSISFFMLKYPVTGGFKGDGFTNLALEIIIAAAETG